MQRIEFNQLAENWDSAIQDVFDNQEPLTVSMGQDREVVIMDAEDYRSLMETVHLLRSPDNADRLREGIRQHKAGMKKEIDVASYLD
jgi:antitoxin YefM